MAYTTHAQAFQHAASAGSSHHHHVTAKRACLGVLLLCIAIAALALTNINTPQIPDFFMGGPLSAVWRAPVAGHYKEVGER